MAEETDTEEGWNGKPTSFYIEVLKVRVGEMEQVLDDLTLKFQLMPLNEKDKEDLGDLVEEIEERLDDFDIPWLLWLANGGKRRRLNN
jgi:hypothetical protein